MNKNEILALKKNRLTYLQGNGKNIQSSGVVKKLIRQIRNLEQE